MDSLDRLTWGGLFRPAPLDHPIERLARRRGFPISLWDLLQSKTSQLRVSVVAQLQALRLQVVEGAVLRGRPGSPSLGVIIRRWQGCWCVRPWRRHLSSRRQDLDAKRESAETDNLPRRRSALRVESPRQPLRRNCLARRDRASRAYARAPAGRSGRATRSATRRSGVASSSRAGGRGCRASTMSRACRVHSSPMNPNH